MFAGHAIFILLLLFPLLDMSFSQYIRIFFANQQPDNSAKKHRLHIFPCPSRCFTLHIVSYLPHIQLYFSSSSVIILFQKLLDLLPYVLHNNSPVSLTRYTSGNSITFTLFMCAFFVVLFQEHF